MVHRNCKADTKRTELWIRLFHNPEHRLRHTYGQFSGTVSFRIYEYSSCFGLKLDHTMPEGC